MTRLIFTLAFLLGALAVLWTGNNFVESSQLGLAVIIVIAAVYLIGLIELMLYRNATGSLARNLKQLPEDSNAGLDNWLAKLHASLQLPVRLRIEGERVPLPMPVITPYLVGLLVMLGLLGTFVGMVDTLKGAVTALEGTTKLEAIRAGLAAPIGGLSLAFGTSVAGVAASAMLGLMSTLSRRDRFAAVRELDKLGRTSLQQFSRNHQQQQTFDALRLQSEGLPELTQKLNSLVDQIGKMNDNIGQSLLANQNQFHESVESRYTALADRVELSLKESMAESGRIAGESIKPIVEDLMKQVSQELQSTGVQTKQQLTESVESQVSALVEGFSQTTTNVEKAWREGVEQHSEASRSLVTSMESSLKSYQDQLQQTTASIQQSMEDRANHWLAEQKQADSERVSTLNQTLAEMNQAAEAQARTVTESITKTLNDSVEQQTQSMTQATQDVSAVITDISSQLSSAGQAALSAEQALSAAWKENTQAMNDSNREFTHSLLEQVSGVLQRSETLLESRLESESNWLESQQQRMDQLIDAMDVQLTKLRDEESERGALAIDRLSDLEEKVAKHLAQLGSALEDPMTRLIDMASETPKAAAEVIEQLRNEISKNIERDNDQLAERKVMMDDLNTLSSALQNNTLAQQSAIEGLVNTSSEVLKDAGERFNSLIEGNVEKIAGITDQFAGSAIEMSSLGEALSLAMTLYNDSNTKLVDGLTTIEKALQQSSERSDEQLGYYVTQAREIIDHNLLSQKEIVEQLRSVSNGVSTNANNAEVAEVS